MSQAGVTTPWIKQLREATKLSQERFAVGIDISSSTLRTWEQGKVEPSLTLKQWDALAEVMGLSLEELRSKIAAMASAS